MTPDEPTIDETPSDEPVRGESTREEIALEKPIPETAVTEPRLCADSGMATAEYAIATLAACGFAALLVVILRSDTVRNLLMGIIKHALSLGS